MRPAVLTMLLLLFTVTVYAEVPPKPAINEHVFDYANVLDNEAEQEMHELIRHVEEQTSNQIVLMTIETIGDMEAFEFGTEVIRQWGIGQAGLNNGMLIYITTAQGEGNNDVWISVGQGLGGQFPDGKLGRMIDYYMMDSLVAGDFTAAFEDILNVTAQEMLGEIEDADPGEASVIGTLFIFLFVVIFIGVSWLLTRLLKKHKKYLTARGWTISSSDSHSSDSDDGFGGGSSDGGGSGRNF